MYYLSKSPSREEPSITAHRTVSLFGHPPQTDDPLASQRAELLGLIFAAETELDRAASAHGGAAASLAHQHRELLANLQRQIGRAEPTSLASLRQQVASAVEQTRSTVQQVRQASVSAESAEIASLATSRLAARESVQSFVEDFYGRKMFDPYLRFSSIEDEEAYRKREEATRRAIEAALAKNTPQGDLEAAKLVQSQLADAGAHGADASPDFAVRTAEIGQRVTQLEQAMGKAPETERDDRSVTTAAIAAPTAPDGPLASVAAALKQAGINGLVSTQRSGHGLTADASASTIRERT